MNLCYVKATDLIHEAITHVLNQSSCDEKLKKELVVWKESQRKATEEIAGTCYSIEESSISFEVVSRLYQQLKIKPLASGPIYLHELMNGSSLCLPQVVIPPRNQELVARLEKIQAAADNKTYNRMVKNVDVSRDDSEFYRLGLEVQATNRQVWAVINFFLTVVCAFVFGYFAGYFADYSITMCVFLGLLCGTVVFIADLYFLVRTDIKPPVYSNTRKKNPQVKQKKD